MLIFEINWNWHCHWRIIQAIEKNLKEVSQYLLWFKKKTADWKFYDKNTNFNIAACDRGKYGKGCKQRCTCKNNGICDHVTGKCDCSRVVGKTGDHCDEGFIYLLKCLDITD